MYTTKPGLTAVPTPPRNPVLARLDELHDQVDAAAARGDRPEELIATVEAIAVGGMLR